MEQVVYGDVLFIINFSMDFLSLYVTAKFIHLRLRLVPAIAAAAIGAVYGVAACNFGRKRAYIIFYKRSGIHFDVLHSSGKASFVKTYTDILCCKPWTRRMYDRTLFTR